MKQPKIVKETPVIIRTFVRGEDKIKAPEREIYMQLDPALRKNVWAFKHTNENGKVTVYRTRNNSDAERERLKHVLRTGQVPGKGNIYHPKNRTLAMPVWLGKFKFTHIGHVQSD